ncbi:hypothetical protein C2G38_2250059 [Gigaspora rosea]|uniref:Uncharacterized protein n=1 Tax=Gigaspora rosea TaxID=44941 RepID=A0A397UWJ2_9GLOM|nr:hypothetical protein C2G38_2250059 [Gigaspora rosea]
MDKKTFNKLFLFILFFNLLLSIFIVDSNITPNPNLNRPQKNDKNYSNSKDLEKRSYKEQKHEPFKKQEHKLIKKQEHKPIKEENPTSTGTCAPLSAPCNNSQPELCCSGFCSTLPHDFPGVGCCNPKGQPCPIETPQACCSSACVIVAGSNPPSYICDG